VAHTAAATGVAKPLSTAKFRDGAWDTRVTVWGHWPGEYWVVDRSNALGYLRDLGWKSPVRKDSRGYEFAIFPTGVNPNGAARSKDLPRGVAGTATRVSYEDFMKASAKSPKCPACHDRHSRPGECVRDPASYNWDVAPGGLQASAFPDLAPKPKPGKPQQTGLFRLRTSSRAARRRGER